MADGFIQHIPDSTGKKVDTSELVVGANTVERQRMVIADDAGTANLAAVTNSPAGSGTYALVTREVKDVEATIVMTGAALGNLVFARVNDSPENFTPDELRPLSMTAEGRLRVSTVPATTYMNLFDCSLGENPSTDPYTINLAASVNPWGI